MMANSDALELLFPASSAASGLGLQLVGGRGESDHPSLPPTPIYVRRVLRDGVAWRDGRLQRGDVVLGVNHVRFGDVTASFARDALKSACAVAAASSAASKDEGPNEGTLKLIVKKGSEEGDHEFHSILAMSSDVSSVRSRSSAISLREDDDSFSFASSFGPLPPPPPVPDIYLGQLVDELVDEDPTRIRHDFNSTPTFLSDFRFSNSKHSVFTSEKCHQTQDFIPIPRLISSLRHLGLAENDAAVDLFLSALDKEGFLSADKTAAPANRVFEVAKKMFKSPIPGDSRESCGSNRAINTVCLTANASTNTASRPEDFPADLKVSSDIIKSLRQERDDAVIEAKKIRTNLEATQSRVDRLEKDLMKLRLEQQATLTENRQLEKDLSSSRDEIQVRRQDEKDFFKVISDLEVEVERLKLEVEDKKIHPDVLKRMSVLTCEVKKLRKWSAAQEAGLHKLLGFLEELHKHLVEKSDLEKDDALTSSLSSTPTIRTMATECRQTVLSVKNLLDGSEPLPFGWERVSGEDGFTYFVDHVNEKSSWENPLSAENFKSNSFSEPLTDLLNNHENIVTDKCESQSDIIPTDAIL